MSDVQNIVIGQKTSSTMIALARELRGRMTSEEKILWEQLRAKRLAGFRFRRQQVVAKYVVDFYCHATALVVEVDGPSHNRQRERDAERDAELSGLGLWILRFSNEDIRRNLSKVVGEIAAACRDRSGPLPFRQRSWAFLDLALGRFPPHDRWRPLILRGAGNAVIC